MATMADRVLRRYKPRFDIRTDRLKHGCCGRPWCFEPAVYVWLDAPLTPVGQWKWEGAAQTAPPVADTT